MQHCAVKTLRNHRAQPAPKPPQIRHAVVPLRPQRKAGCSCGGGCPACKALSVSPAHDPAEREADRVADQVMRMAEPAVGPGLTALSEHSGAAPVQRVCAECEADLNRKPAHETIQRQEDEEEELQLKRSDGAVQRQEQDEEEDLIQPKEAPGAGPALTASTESAISGLRGGGAPLPASERAFFEPRFGRSFADVRIHDGPAADKASRGINARAFTLGTDIAFAHGEHKPRTEAGRRLMAHELTHVVQQGGATIQKASLPTNDDKALETEPDKMRAKVLGNDLKHTIQQETSADIYSPNRLGIEASMPNGCSSLQRVADKSNPPTNMRCDRVDPSPGGSGGTHVVFGKSGQTINNANTELIAAEFASWVARGSIDSITVDGFASSEGSAGVNWRLSCNRAEIVKAEFVRLGVPGGMLTTIAHGETEEFLATDFPPNRRAVIRIIRTPQPSPNPGCPTNITENTTLTTNCGPEGIALGADNVILDCAGNTLTGPGTGNGILLRDRTGVRIVNCRVTNFRNGFALRNSSANTFTNNSSFRNIRDGFDIDDSNGNIFIQNNVSDNTDHGIELDGSSDNRFIQNTVTGNNDGFDTEGPPRDGTTAPNNTFILNNADNNRGAGFRILSNGNTIRGNRSNNSEDGFRIQGNANTLSGNTANNSIDEGFRIQGNDNTLSGNTANNSTGRADGRRGDGFRIEGNDNTLSGNSGNGNSSQDVDVRNNTTGNTCTGNTFGTTNGSCPPDVP